MKRKRVGEDMMSEFYSYAGYPALKSTLKLDVGGEITTEPSNFQSRVTNALGGVNRIVYDSPFWSKDFFASTYQNCLSALIVSVYQNLQYRTVLFPLVIPRQTITYYNDDSISASDRFLKLQESLSYALNLLFSKEGYVLEYNSLTQQSEWNVLTINDSTMPILQTSQLPPLLFEIYPMTGQLMLKRNLDYVPDNPDDYDIAFNIVSFQNSWTPYNTNPGISIFNAQHGWFGNGFYLFGFGNWNASTDYYVDDYYNQSSTFFREILETLGPVVVNTTTNWSTEIVEKYFLKKYFMVGAQSCTLLETKYYIIQSTQLTRLQKRPFTSNTFIPMSHTIGIFFNDVFRSGKYQKGNGVTYLGNPYLPYDSSQSHNEIDIRFIDEFGNILKSGNSQSSVDNDFFENDSTSPAQFIIPIPYTLLDPFYPTNTPKHDCIFPYYKINQNIVLNSNIPFNTNAVIASKPSTAITHLITLYCS